MNVLNDVVYNSPNTSGGLRYSEGKLRYDLFPPDAYEEIVRVFTEGAKKYKDRNWEAGMKWSECLRALKSHLTKWEKGQVFDDELTECRHLAMVAWNAIALLSYELRQIGENNIPGQMNKLFKTAQMTINPPRPEPNISGNYPHNLGVTVSTKEINGEIR